MVTKILAQQWVIKLATAFAGLLLVATVGTIFAYPAVCCRRLPDMLWPRADRFLSWIADHCDSSCRSSWIKGVSDQARRRSYW